VLVILGQARFFVIQDYNVLPEKNTLYVVATPIGNLGDMSQRAQQVLSSVDVIAAEDTRHSGKLLNYFGISTPCIAFHEHNERQVSESILNRLEKGESVALISDAGTPLLSDPGYHLVRAVHQRGLKVVPVPGASALLAALSVAGLATDCFKFVGFLPAKSAARQLQLADLKQETCTLVFYESPHRIVESLTDMASNLGGERMATLARELTKTFETVKQDKLAALRDWVSADQNQQRGELVVMVEGWQAPERQALDEETIRVLKILVAELPVKQAAKLAAEISGEKKNRLYQYALEHLKD
jgi:16S rRNA (cytidine1402-2'-O)-methyltransferase